MTDRLRNALFRTLLCILGGIAALPARTTSLRAQARVVVVDVTVTDAAGSPIAGVDLTLRRLGSRDVLTGTTDQRGTHRFQTSVDTGAMSLVARKVGYAPVAEEFRADSTVTAVIRVTLTRAPAVLDTTRVTADVPRSKNYYIGAADIAKSTRYIEDALDAVSKIHPEMLGDGYRLCPGVKYIWINGVRAYSQSTMPAAARNSNRVLAAGVRERPVGSSGNIRDRINDLGPPNVAQILASVHVDHLSEIRYVNCWDKSMPGVGGQDALYIVLKPGVSWDLKRGSRVIDSTVFKEKP